MAVVKVALAAQPIQPTWVPVQVPVRAQLDAPVRFLST